MIEEKDRDGHQETMKLDTETLKCIRNTNMQPSLHVHLRTSD